MLPGHQTGITDTIEQPEMFKDEKGTEEACILTDSKSVTISAILYTRDTRLERD